MFKNVTSDKNWINFVVIIQTRFNSYSVLEQIWIKGSYPDQRLSQHESLYPIGLKSAGIETPTLGPTT